MVHRDPISSLSDFEESIEHHVRNIPLFMQLSTVEPAILRFKMVTDSGGSFFEHVLCTFVDFLYVLNKAMIRHPAVVFETHCSFFPR